MTERFPNPNLEQAIRDRFKHLTNAALVERYVSLATAIQCAIDNGWQLPDEHKGWDIGELAEWLVNMDVYQRHIFGHNFAKALWGDEPQYSLETRDQYGSLTVDSDTFMLTNWQYHLQNMVIADDPIEYLAEHLEAGDAS